MLKRWRRKGGEGGAPGDYDKLVEKLNSVFDDDDNEQADSLRQMLEGTDDDDWTDFQSHYNNILQEDKRNDFMNTLNIIKWIDGPFMYKEDVTLD